MDCADSRISSRDDAEDSLLLRRLQLECGDCWCDAAWHHDGFVAGDPVDLATPTVPGWLFVSFRLAVTLLEHVCDLVGFALPPEAYFYASVEAHGAGVGEHLAVSCLCYCRGREDWADTLRAFPREWHLCGAELPLSVDTAGRWVQAKTLFIAAARSAASRVSTFSFGSSADTFQDSAFGCHGIALFAAELDGTTRLGPSDLDDHVLESDRAQDCDRVESAPCLRSVFAATDWRF